MDDYAPAWRPIEGEVLEGTVTALDSRETEYGLYPILTIQPDEGTAQAVHAFHSTLKDALLKAKPEVGERIAIRYDGVRTSKSSGRDYHAYRVESERRHTTTWEDFDTFRHPVPSDIPTDLPWSPVDDAA